mgnify:CR=1 FL=1
MQRFYKKTRILKLYDRRIVDCQGQERQGDNRRTEYVTFAAANNFVSENSCIYADEYMERNINMILFEIAKYCGEGNIKMENHILKWGYYNKECMRQQVLSRLVWDDERKVVGIECSLCICVMKCELLRNIYN